MRKLFLLLVLLVSAMSCFLANAQNEVATFSRSNFTGWTYVNKADIDLSAQTIGQGRILLFGISQDNVRELISPYLDYEDADSLVVEVTYRPVEDANYRMLTLKVALCDMNGEEQSVSLVPMPGALPSTEYEYSLRTSLAVAEGGSMQQLHFTAPYADSYNCAAVMEVHVLAVKVGDLELGDVNGDGMVDVEDVNALINIILKLKTVDDYPGDANVDGMGVVDVGDVNRVINIILKRV